jgi:hypothetical protein
MRGFPLITNRLPVVREMAPTVHLPGCCGQALHRRRRPGRFRRTALAYGGALTASHLETTNGGWPTGRESFCWQARSGKPQILRPRNPQGRRPTPMRSVRRVLCCACAQLFKPGQHNAGLLIGVRFAVAWCSSFSVGGVLDCPPSEHKPQRPDMSGELAAGGHDARNAVQLRIGVDWCFAWTWRTIPAVRASRHRPWKPQCPS